LNVGIVGSGLQCNRRIEAILSSGTDSISLIVGNNPTTLDAIQGKYGIPVSLDTERLFADESIEAVLICTPPSSHYYYMRLGIMANKKILVEKPISKTTVEIDSLISEFGEQVSELVRCGFNHRFHPGIQMAKRYIHEKKIGDVLFGRSIYGISARPNYTHEWRADAEIAAGGQFIEQGSHQIDLFQWLIGPVKGIYCKTSNNIFMNQILDDGGMAILTFEGNVSAQMHTTLAQWHNRFEIELYGTKGFIKVSGLGNTYGTEIFEHGDREDSAPFNSHFHQFRGPDKSWVHEWDAFKQSFKTKTSDIGTISDAYHVMSVAEAGYKSNSVGCEVKL
jgi:predicted dehydrogenase